jgi:hypothetical protein
MKTRITCTAWRGVRKNTLQGFATIRIDELHMSVRDVAVHEKDGARWAAPPARPQLSKEGAAIRDEAGKVQYSPVLEFDGRQVRDAFSEAVIRAVLRHDPHAFDASPQERRPAAAAAPLADSEIPF